MAKRHVIVGGGTAGLNAVTTIREYDGGESEISWVSNERTYSRMVLPYYLWHTISESHVFTANPQRMEKLGVTPFIGRTATKLDTGNNTLTLDDDTVLEYDDILIATGSRAIRPPIPGADGRAVHSFWTLDHCRAVLQDIQPGCELVVVGAGFISFTIINSLIALGAKLTIVEVAPQILPRMVDRQGAEMVQKWLEKHGVTVKTDVRITSIEDVDGRKKLNLQSGEPIIADLVIMATGIRSNLEWLEGSGVTINQGIVVDDHLRSNIANVYAGGDVAEGKNAVTGAMEVHAIEPTAMEHGRVIGANMAGVDTAYRGSILMNIIDVQHLEVASFGEWNATNVEVIEALDERRNAYRKYLWDGDVLKGAIIIGLASDIWVTNDVGMLKGLVQSKVPVGAWKEHMRRNPWDIKRPFVASHTTSMLLPQRILDHPSVPATEVRTGGVVRTRSGPAGTEVHVD